MPNCTETTNGHDVRSQVPDRCKVAVFMTDRSWQ